MDWDFQSLPKCTEVYVLLEVQGSLVLETLIQVAPLSDRGISIGRVHYSELAIAVYGLCSNIQIVQPISAMWNVESLPTSMGACGMYVAYFEIVSVLQALIILHNNK